MLKNILYLIATVVIGWYLFHLVAGILAFVYYVILPFAVVTGIVYALYVTVGKKAISGGRRTLP